MTTRFLYMLPVLAGVGLLMGGCATTGSSLLGFDPNKPHTFLAGAEVEQAKSVAMGSAVSNGWKVVESSNNRLVVRRPLNAAVAESVAGAPVSAASLEVKTDFYKRQDGVDAVVAATMITNRGSKGEKKINVTDRYKDDLIRSLNSLQRAWDENRWRVASSTPPLPTKVAIPEDEGRVRTSTVGRDAQIADSGTGSAPGEGVRADSTGASPPATAAIMPSAGGGGPAPVEDRYAAATPPPVSTSAAPASPADSMLVLNRQAEPGVWAYYAEHYAKIRGCELSDDGAVLEQRQPEYEVHRVYCEGGQTFLVKCNAGACRGLE